jgi:hypothetical protein
LENNVFEFNGGQALFLDIRGPKRLRDYVAYDIAPLGAEKVTGEYTVQFEKKMA